MSQTRMCSTWRREVQPSMQSWSHRSNPLSCSKLSHRACSAFFKIVSRSIVDQVTQFNQILAPKPVGAQWNSNNSLFAFWIGINDVVSRNSILRMFPTLIVR